MVMSGQCCAVGDGDGEVVGAGGLIFWVLGGTVIMS
jgi:hypothetical protein